MRSNTHTAWHMMILSRYINDDDVDDVDIITFQDFTFMCLCVCVGIAEWHTGSNCMQTNIN